MTVNRDDSNRSGIKTIAVVGCGLMGCGVAEVAALAGFDVVAIKATAGEAEPIRTKIAKSFDRAVTNGKLTAEKRDEALARIKVSSDLGDAAEADLVIESAVESAIAKKRLLSELEGIVRADTI